MPQNTLGELKVGITRLEHLYEAFRRTGELRYADQARVLLKQIHQQFKELSHGFGIGHEEFRRMMRGDE